MVKTVNTVNTVRRVSATLCAVLLAASCGSSQPTTSEPTTTTALDWTSCNGVECADLEVPFDYDDPSLGTFTLKVSRQRALKADQRVGVLIVNPGGPGGPGVSLAQNAAFYFSRDIIERFDIVAWDPRGTGASTPAVDCIDNYDDYFTRPLDAQTAQRFIDACTERSGDVLPYVGTANSARDIDALRRALGEESVSYFGFSYGGVLGLTWRGLFPETVRAMVLDAPPNPAASRAERIAAQAAVFESLLDEFLEPPGRKAAWNSVMASPPAGITTQMVLAATISALYDTESRGELETALTAASAGDGSKIRAMYEGFYYQDAGFEDLRNTFEAAVAISCVDDTTRTPIDDLTKVAPRLHAFFAPDELCSRWPAATSESYDPPAAGASPTVIIGATKDPASPFAGVRAVAMASGNARLITVEGNRHTSYFGVDCVTALVDSYLIGLTDPGDTTCPPGAKISE